METKEGRIKLSDGSVLKLKITIIDARESGFSPFGGINIKVKVVGGIAVLSVPEEIREKFSRKPLTPSKSEPPHDGWEIIKIVNYEPARANEDVETSQGLFRVEVVAEPVMASRNVNYRTEFNEPLYWLSWIYKISWGPIDEKRNVA